jgi:hypothetical protein
MFLWVTENSPNGTVVNNQSLKANFLGLGNGLNYGVDSVSNSSDSDIKFATFKGTSPTQSGLTILVTYLAASVAGVLNVVCFFFLFFFFLVVG